MDEYVAAVNSTVLVVGRRGCGKTTTMQHMLHSVMEKLDVVHVFARNRDSLEEYEESIPGCNVHRMLCPKHLKTILDDQEVKRGERAMGIVLDENLCWKTDFNSVIRRLMTNGRHFNVFVLIAVSNLEAVPKDLRSQLDAVVMFPEMDTYLQPLWEAWLKDAFPTKEECILAFTGLPAHTALVIDVNVPRTAMVYSASQLPSPPPHHAPDVDFVVTWVTEVRKTVEFVPPVHVDLHAVDAADGCLTLFAKHDVLREFLRSGTNGVLLRHHIPEEVRKCTGLVFAYKAVSNSADVSWASENMLQKISISE